MNRPRSRSIRSGSDPRNRITIDPPRPRARTRFIAQNFLVMVIDVHGDSAVWLSRLKMRYLHAAIGALLDETQ